MATYSSIYPHHYLKIMKEDKIGDVCLATKLCPTLCHSMDCSPPGSSVHGISQARILEWVAISSFRGSSQPRNWTHMSGGSCLSRQILYPEPPGKPNIGDEATFFFSKKIFFWSAFQIIFLSVFPSKGWTQFTEQLFLIPQRIGLQSECYTRHWHTHPIILSSIASLYQGEDL